MLKSVVEISGLFVFEPKVFNDRRGYFFESFNEKIFQEQDIKFDVAQENQSRSRFGTIRGLHYQSGKNPQAKFVRVVRGEILDVAVDIRSDSPSYGKHYSIILSEENKKGLFIPQGFAHGFSVLSNVAEVVYLCDAHYESASEGGIRFDDSELAIDWQIEIPAVNVSEKDREQSCFSFYKAEPKF